MCKDMKKIANSPSIRGAFQPCFALEKKDGQKLCAKSAQFRTLFVILQSVFSGSVLKEPGNRIITEQK